MSKMKKVLKSLEDTSKEAKAIAKAIDVGDIILLKGEMGAGKTTITKSIVKALGSDDYVTSPTFAIMNVYKAPDKVIYHFDLYRLTKAVDIDTLGLDDYVYDERAISLIEWPEAVEKEFKDAKAISLIKDGETRILETNFDY